MPSASRPPPDMVVKNRFLGFLIWQSIPSTAVFLFFRAFFSTVYSAETHSSSFPLLPSLIVFVAFLAFHLSQLLFSASLSVVSSPQPHPSATLLELALKLIRVLVFPGGSEPYGSPEFRRRARVSLCYVLFSVAAALSGLVAIASVCWVSPTGEHGNGVRLVGRVGFRGFVAGLIYGAHYVYKHRWVLEFPIIQVSRLLLVHSLCFFMKFFRSSPLFDR